jgi:hypothetical protein
VKITKTKLEVNMMAKEELILIKIYQVFEII